MWDFSMHRCHISEFAQNFEFQLDVLSTYVIPNLRLRHNESESLPGNKECHARALNTLRFAPSQVEAGRFGAPSGRNSPLELDVSFGCA